MSGRKTVELSHDEVVRALEQVKREWLGGEQ